VGFAGLTKTGMEKKCASSL